MCCCGEISCDRTSTGGELFVRIVVKIEGRGGLKDGEFLDERVKYRLRKYTVQLCVLSGLRRGLNEIFAIFICFIFRTLIR